MKKIIFIRHAKSSWDHDISDLKRPLSERGIADAQLLAGIFSDYKYDPQGVFSSPATRARITCQQFMEAIGWPDQKVIIDERLYDFGGNKVLQFIKTLNNELNQIMIFGHNHAFTTVVNDLGDLVIDNVPTTGLVVINFDILNWKDISKGHTELFLKPKDFK